jgi:hypothetical protein
MKILIQDPALRCSYILNEDELEKFVAPYEDKLAPVDLVFMVPNDSLLDEIVPAQSNVGPILTIAIIDPLLKKRYVISREDLEKFESEKLDFDKETISFSIPSSLELIEQVDLFRKALVQYSS